MWPYYYPVRIGEVFACRYQVVGKLGFGMTATTWLARDLKHSRYVVLKIYLESRFLGYREPPEIAAYECLNAGPKDHPGRKAIRRLLGWFTIMGPTGKHYCLVHPPLWGSLSDWLETQKSCICTGCTNFPRVTAHMLAVILRQIFLALDYAKECDIVHTDISANNVMFEIQDNSVLEEIERAELEDPMPRKEIHGRFIYQSYLIPLPKNAAGPGLPLLYIYRAPEVCLGMRWGFEVDIWNVGCMIWNIFEGNSLFDGQDPGLQYRFSTRSHLAQMVWLLGPPSREFLMGGSPWSMKYFAPDGKGSLREVETSLKFWEGEGEDRDLFIRFMKKMLQWDPKDRQTARQLLEDEWLTNRLKRVRRPITIRPPAQSRTTHQTARVGRSPK
ncbi:Dual specificity tyrosine-phosphorylation-regulated kinase mbk-2 [Termitomyces sp. J132]|nr:Dual specificity tyrosine-phosphorylation-regulated kinase mbk-2 [Termitomyces sp. J132]